MSYVDPSPHTYIGKMRQIVYDLLQEHEQAGTIPTSARFLFYELVARGIISKEKPENDNRPPAHRLYGALSDLRKQGDVPWDWISDETRAIEHYVGAKNVADWMGRVLEQARLDPWDGDPPLVLAESRSVAGALRETCDRYAVRLAATNGQVGGFLHTDVVPILSPSSRVLYFGDWDLCGNDIEANTRSVLEDGVGVLEWERLALTEQQVKRYKLPKIVKDDKRFKDSGGLHEAVETEALSQQLITKLLQRRLDELLPEPLDDVLERERRQRAAFARKMMK